MNKKLILVMIAAAIFFGAAACFGETQDDGISEGEKVFDGDIRGVTWQWVRFDDTADQNNIIVEDPTLYTLTLNEDGTYSAKADCNLSNGGYELQDSSLNFNPGPTTLAECEPGSLYNTFLADLGYVTTYVMDGNNLVLNLWADGGNMIFQLAK